MNSSIQNLSENTKRVIKFTLSAPHAHIREESMNQFLYSTYLNPHRNMLLGLLGNIIGLKGYNSLNRQQEPEWYQKLKHIKYAIINNGVNGEFTSQNVVYTNTTKQINNGNSLQIREVWLYDVSWTIYLVIEDKITEKIADYIINKKRANGMLYLGKGQHYAIISDASVENINKVPKSENIETVKSLMLKDDIEIEDDTFEEDEFYLLRQNMPVGFVANTLHPLKKEFIWTNGPIQIINFNNFYRTVDNGVIQII